MSIYSPLQCYQDSIGTGKINFGLDEETRNLYNGSSMKNNNGLLLTDDGHCVGYLFNFTGNGIFSPDGKVEVTQEQVDKHNTLLAEAEIKGLDECCEVGQHGTFYYVNGRVQTFTGVIVAEGSKVRQSGQVITFSRNVGGIKKVFRGRLQKNADCFNFKRVS